MKLGVGYRDNYHKQLVSETPEEVRFFEFLFDNLIASSKLMETSMTIAESFPVTLHSVSLNIAGTDPLDLSYLEKMKQAIQVLKPFAVSDHLCFSHHQNAHHHDLLPIPYTKDGLKHCVERVDKIQSFLDFPIALENLSAYLRYSQSDMSEFEFLEALCKQTGCKILVDFNNIIVNQINHGEESFQDEINRLFQIDPKYFAYGHIAGYEEFDGTAVDTHGANPSKETIELANKFIRERQKGEFSLLLEWDQSFPEFDDFYQTIKIISQGVNHD